MSNLGRVRTARGIITEGSERTDGHLVTQINGKFHRVRRLVALAGFLPTPLSEAHTQIKNMDGDLTNNRADNLEWVTRSEQSGPSLHYACWQAAGGQGHHLCTLPIGHTGEHLLPRLGRTRKRESVITAARELKRGRSSMHSS